MQILRKHIFQLDTQGKLRAPSQGDVSSLNEAKAQEEDMRAYQHVRQTLDEIGTSVGQIVGMDGSSVAVSAWSQTPPYPSEPSLLRKLVNWNAEQDYAVAQKASDDWFVGGRDSAAAPGLVVALRENNRFNVEAEARFDPATTPASWEIKRNVKNGDFSGLEALTAEWSNPASVGGSGASNSRPARLKFEKFGELDIINQERETLKYNDESKTFEADGTIMTRIVINHANDTLSFEQTSTTG